MAVIAGLACAFVIGKALPAIMDTISTNRRAAMRGRRSHGIGARFGRTDHLARFCQCAGQARDDRARVLRARRIYPRASPCRLRNRFTSPKVKSARSLPEARSRPSRSASRSLEPPGATHLVIANASNQRARRLIAVFVADEGAHAHEFIE